MHWQLAAPKQAKEMLPFSSVVGKKRALTAQILERGGFAM